MTHKIIWHSLFPHRPVLRCLEKQNSFFYFIDIDDWPHPLHKLYHITLPTSIPTSSTHGIIRFHHHYAHFYSRFELLAVDGNPDLVSCGEILEFYEISETDLPLYVNWEFKSPDFLKG